jgi:hypothetical protein
MRVRGIVFKRTAAYAGQSFYLGCAATNGCFVQKWGRIVERYFSLKSGFCYRSDQMFGVVRASSQI